MSPARFCGGLLVSMCLWSGSLPAQSAGGPILGWVADAGSTRPILGVPGAALVGPATEDGSAFRIRAISPRGNYAVAENRQSSQVGLRMTGAAFRAFAGIAPGAGRVALSPEGTAAVFCYEAEGRVLVVTGLPDSPAAPFAVPVDPARNNWRDVAVSDDGQLLLAIEAEAAIVLARSGEVGRITLSQGVTAVAFAAGSHDAVVAGGAMGVLVRDVEHPVTRVPLWTEGLGAISAVAIAPDGRRVLLADAGAQRVVVVSLGETGQRATTLACACAPSRLARINDDSVYRLTDYTGGTLYLLDGAATPPRVVVASPTLESDK